MGADRKVYAFNMVQLQGRWQLQNPDICTEWIVQIEQKLAFAIVEEKQMMKKNTYNGSFTICWLYIPL